MIDNTDRGLEQTPVEADALVVPEDLFVRKVKENINPEYHKQVLEKGKLKPGYRVASHSRYAKPTSGNDIVKGFNEYRIYDENDDFVWTFTEWTEDKIDISPPIKVTERKIESRQINRSAVHPKKKPKRKKRSKSASSSAEEPKQWRYEEPNASLEPISEGPEKSVLWPSSPSDYEGMSPTQRQEWFKEKLGPYEELIQQSARRHAVPSQLIAAVIANELVDIKLTDIAQQNTLVRTGSVGIAQIQISTAMENQLVDVTEEEISNYIRRNTNEVRYKGTVMGNMPSREVAIGVLIGEKLKTPAWAIEACAREISTIIEKIKIHSSNKWSKYFMAATPGDLVSPNDIYQSVRGSKQIQKEEYLAQMVVAAYNSPDIIIAKKPGSPFSDFGYFASYKDARRHGNNVLPIASDIYEMGLFR